MSDGPVSAIVVTYFTGPVLKKCLAALAEDEAVGEIILVDNGNPSGAVNLAVRGLEDHIRIRTGHGNIGFAAACNLGAAEAKGEYLLLINPDAIISDGGVSKLLDAGKDRARPWLMGAKLVGPDGVEQQGSRRSELTPWRAIFEASKLSWIGPHIFPPFNQHRTPAPRELAEIPTLSGACLFLPAEDYRRISGMDEDYFLHVEDIDFCKRFADAGGAVWFNPHVTVTHHKSSSAATVREVEAHKTRGLIRYFNMHFRKSWPAPMRWVLTRGLWLIHGLKNFNR